MEQFGRKEKVIRKRMKINRRNQRKKTEIRRLRDQVYNFKNYMINLRNDNDKEHERELI